MAKPVLGITLGDPNGIGPEIAARAALRTQVRRECVPLLIGREPVLRRALAAIGMEVDIRLTDSAKDAHNTENTLNLIQPNHTDCDGLLPGTIQPQAGRMAYDAVILAIDLAMRHEIDGTVTAPLHKEALHLAGVDQIGHTEIYATHTGTRDYCMMLLDGRLRVSHVSTHVSLRQAVERVTVPRVLRVITLTNQALQALGVNEPRIAVAGLNPHAGEGGLLGEEEIIHIQPALRQAQQQGIAVSGPYPPDTVFALARGGRFDAVVCMYHDQGHIPLKTLGFRLSPRDGRISAVRGVNVTLGLPVLRTSVDHGTAFDQAYRGTASDQSMVSAIRCAARLARGGLLL